ncbi:MAG: class I SAM-dependent methyltransferase [Proteobacteria bacterium]|nr:class I SAM-dependent methyltransferase [Pseudomonadota bacterium]
MKPGFNKKVKLNITKNFDDSCKLYQDFEDKHLFFESLALKLAESINIKPNTTVLDVGCGTGVSAIALNKQYSCKVLGVDISAKMVEVGKILCNSGEIELVVGDGERLSEIVRNRLFDYVFYNASIFMFPDIKQAIKEACRCLLPNGKIAFSFYPQIVDENGEDLIPVAFKRLGETPPRFRVITDFDKICLALKNYCGPVTHHKWVRDFNIEFLKDFFSIPAQSASLFPGKEYDERRKLVSGLFETLKDISGKSNIIWRMAESTLTAS